MKFGSWTYDGGKVSIISFPCICRMLIRWQGSATLYGVQFL
jgi:hypothetical protein